MTSNPNWKLSFHFVVLESRHGRGSDSRRLASAFDIWPFGVELVPNDRTIRNR